MKLLTATRTLSIPEGVTVEIKGRRVRVKGPRGTLTKSFTHLDVDAYLADGEDGQKQLKVDVWFGKRATLAAIRTLCSHVQNMITGTTKGFRYKVRLVYAHFPVNVNIEGGDKIVEIRNFLGEKRVRRVHMLEGVKVLRNPAIKDELMIEGNDLELVSRSAALCGQACLVKNKVRLARPPCLRAPAHSSPSSGHPQVP
jgi:large subunit ribosomal protein L9e